MAIGAESRSGSRWRSLRSALGNLHPLLASDGFWQLVRFAIAGAGVTFFSVVIYSVAAAMLHVAPLAANSLSWMCGVVAGYLVHSRWSFAAERDGGEGRMFVRFLAVAAFGLALNSLWVWITTGLLHLHPLAPVPAMVFVTPVLSFLLNRYWVFEAA
jgi:putative flippase GtrA